MRFGVMWNWNKHITHFYSSVYSQSRKKTSKSVKLSCLVKRTWQCWYVRRGSTQKAQDRKATLNRPVWLICALHDENHAGKLHCVTDGCGNYLVHSTVYRWIEDSSKRRLPLFFLFIFLQWSNFRITSIAIRFIARVFKTYCNTN